MMHTSHGLVFGTRASNHTLSEVYIPAFYKIHWQDAYSCLGSAAVAHYLFLCGLIANIMTAIQCYIRWELAMDTLNVWHLECLAWTPIQ